MNRAKKEALAIALRARKIRRLKTRCRESLVEFIKAAWPILEPSAIVFHQAPLQSRAKAKT